MIARRTSLIVEVFIYKRRAVRRVCVWRERERERERDLKKREEPESEGEKARNMTYLLPIVYWYRVVQIQVKLY